MKFKTFPVPVLDPASKVTGGFWEKRMNLAREKVIPYQWLALNDQIPDAAPSYCMQNFKIAAGLAEGKFQGCIFQDSDVAKWIEAVGNSLLWHPDPELEKTADEAIDIICKAQKPDGYLDTCYIINNWNYFNNLRDDHELYCAGHMLEGAIAYYLATGKDKLLKTMMRYMDLIDRMFGHEEGKIHGYPGHEVLEMALVKLWQVTGEKKYLNLAKYFIDERGQSPLYFEKEQQEHHLAKCWEGSAFGLQYYQAGKPVRDQHDAEGHAVRATYLYSGMADVARETQDESLKQACQNLWNSITRRRMYITGGIGSQAYGESFSCDYDLPNDTVYAESCASIGLAFFARRMLELDIKAEYADVLEKTLYNGILSGISLDGTKFFYVNPLEVVPELVAKAQPHRHIAPQRQKWFGCACCPPNIARLLCAIPSYAYTAAGDSLFVHLYMNGSYDMQTDGKNLHLDVETAYPWEGDIAFSVSSTQDIPCTLALRIPGWCRKYTVSLNGQPISGEVTDGYLYLNRTWKNGDLLRLTLDMPVEMIRSNPAVRDDADKVAVMRGPIVYCLEEADNGNNLHLVHMAEKPEFKAVYEPDLLDGVVSITSNGRRMKTGGWENALYAFDTPDQYEDISLKWVPYYAWANRSLGEMTVWVRK